MADPAGESDDPHHYNSSAPHTPLRRLRRQNGSNASSPGRSSPLGSPAMSLSSLGLSPLSPLRHRLSPLSLALYSPASPSYPQEGSERPGPDHGGRGGQDAAIHGNRDVLVQRLQDLAARLSRQPQVNDDESISILHAKVDELEGVLNTPVHSHEFSPPKAGLHNHGGSNLSLGEPPCLNRLPLSNMSRFALPARLPSMSPAATQGNQSRTARRSKSESRASNITVEQADRMIAEAQDLHKNLNIVISNLRDRQEETEHIHALLITRLERAAQRIIYLEDQIRDSEADRKESGRELLNLRIRLKAIEVRCLSHVPRDADPELDESIDVWNSEWSALKQRRAKDKEERVLRLQQQQIQLRLQEQDQDQGYEDTPTRSRMSSFLLSPPRRPPAA